jgi:hypothetical protein
VKLLTSEHDLVSVFLQGHLALRTYVWIAAVAPQEWLRGRTALVSASHTCPSSGRISISASTTFKVRARTLTQGCLLLPGCMVCVCLYHDMRGGGAELRLSLDWRGYELDDSWFYSRQEPSLGPNQIPLQSVQGVKWRGLRQTTRLHLQGEIKNEWFYTCTHVYGFIGCTEQLHLYI